MKQRKLRMQRAAFRAWMRSLCREVIGGVCEKIMADFKAALAAEAARMDSQIKYGTDTPPCS